MEFGLKPQRFTTQLPPVPCTQELRGQVSDFAKLHRVSMAQVQRVALIYFLANYNNSSDEGSKVQPLEG